MSRQCRFFLLPSDTEVLLDDLQSHVGFKIISTTSERPTPVELQSPFSEHIDQRSKTEFRHVSCYLMPPTESDIQMRYLAEQRQWSVSDCSEVVEFSGCDYDNCSLRIGRFYFQTDRLIGDTIWPKRNEFLQWADRIFRRTKKLLQYSKALYAYVGKDAAIWERGGGHLKDL